ncbi:hypothetical protein OC25_05165 [Pedobacter kyungheensis]|uniref:Uncharacterized protein n=1 Tax=Pedobacter kyungheensis TaxID=1069985 RepID=A0A0C1DE48_9SPHI|nr:hypothetical protein [Pedobacter kyungheensis]KIA95936.1 hypothetical protein OC25_05165 [Pedobacter kyungheensis]
MINHEKELIEKIDLHCGRHDFSENKNYVEFSFYACFYELLNIENSYWDTNFNGNEIFEILTTLKIEIDRDFLIKRYNDRTNNDVEVFHSNFDEQVFAFFDLEKEETDQNDMFFFGLRCLKKDEPIINQKLLKIYRELMTSSPFEFDILNHRLYNKTFRSYFYFYDRNYNPHKRQIHHHNLSTS